MDRSHGLCFALITQLHTEIVLRTLQHNSEVYRDLFGLPFIHDDKRAVHSSFVRSTLRFTKAPRLSVFLAGGIGTLSVFYSVELPELTHRQRSRYVSAALPVVYSYYCRFAAIDLSYQSPKRLSLRSG